MPSETKRCPYCAEEILAVAIKCKHCQADLPKQTNVNNTGEDIEPSNLASRRKRLVGALADGLIQMGVSIPVLFVMYYNDQLKLTDASQVQFTVGQQIFFIFFGLAVFLAINGYFLAKHGQTIGKKLVGTRIVNNADGRILSLPHVFGLRYFPLWAVNMIPVIGPWLAFIDPLFIFRRDRRCVHDLLAGTKVVDA